MYALVTITKPRPSFLPPILFFSCLPAFSTPCMGQAGWSTGSIRQVDKLRPGEAKELTQNSTDSPLQTGVLAPNLTATEKVERDVEVSRGGPEPTLRGRVTGPGLAYITQHTCSPPHASHVCANVQPSTSHTPGPLSLASEPPRLRLNKLD